jgi:hypothetical protein
MNPIHIVTFCLFKIHFNIFLHRRLGLSDGFFPSGFLTKLSMYFFLMHMNNVIQKSQILNFWFVLLVTSNQVLSFIHTLGYFYRWFKSVYVWIWILTFDAIGSKLLLILTATKVCCCLLLHEVSKLFSPWRYILRKLSMSESSKTCLVV